ncbi:MAG TPA: gluconokinase [Thermoanaerobaculia bacterium]|nr:gluconokinase [Thermoanaerobaculia bacterium]
MIIVIMGVSGAGKSTVGAELARSLGWQFFDADDFHSPENIRKMRTANPLSDEDRLPWLEALRALVSRLSSRGENAVLACSALRNAFRHQLETAGDDVRFVYLSAPVDVLDERLRNREGHFMPAGLLASQIAALEPPDDALLADASLPPSELAAAIRLAYGLDA